MTQVVMIGSGNLATGLSLAMREAGIHFSQVYSRTADHAQRLANTLDCLWTTDERAIQTNADLYVFSLRDSVLQEIISRVRPNNGLWVHTAGSISMSVFEGFNERYGVLYPLQTFSRMRAIDLRHVPFFLEAHTTEDEKTLRAVASQLTSEIHFLPSEQRKLLHLAAVFACNFTNHMYALAQKVLSEGGIDPNVLLPLIDETAAKTHEMSASKAQTGPAIRYDRSVMDRHLAMLDDPDMRELYKIISQSIHKETQHEQHTL